MPKMTIKPQKKQQKKTLSRQETPNSVLEGVYVLNQNFDT